MIKSRAVFVKFYTVNHSVGKNFEVPYNVPMIAIHRGRASYVRVKGNGLRVFSKVIFTDFVLPPSFPVVNMWRIIIVNCTRVHIHFSSRADERLGLISSFIAADVRRVSRWFTEGFYSTTPRLDFESAATQHVLSPIPVSDLSGTTISPLFFPADFQFGSV